MVENLRLFNRTLIDSTPIFQVDAVLIASEAVLRPSPGEIYNIIIQNGKNLLEELKEFPRWLNGTCLECRPQRKSDSDQYVTLSFFEDVMSIQVNNASSHDCFDAYKMMRTKSLQITLRMKNSRFE